MIISHNFWGLRIQEWLSWMVLAQGFPWDCGQAIIGWDCSLWRLLWSWGMYLQVHSCDLWAGNLNSSSCAAHDMDSTNASDPRWTPQAFRHYPQKWYVFTSTIVYWSYRPTLLQYGTWLHEDVNTRGQNSMGVTLGAAYHAILHAVIYLYIRSFVGIR